MKIRPAYLLFLVSLNFLIIANTKGQSKNFEINLKYSVKLKMAISIFDSSNHKITYCSINNINRVCYIDNMLFMGTDWTLPYNQLDELLIIIDGATIALDVSNMYNPWSGENPPIKQFKINKTEGGYLLRGLFSDGAASYIAEWKIIKNRSIRTIISNNENFVLEFLDDN